MGRLVVEALSGSIIQLFNDKSNVFFRDTPKVCSFGKIETDDAVGILIGPSLPGGVWIGKIHGKTGPDLYVLKLGGK